MRARKPVQLKPSIGDLRRVQNRVNYLANQYEYDKARELLTMVGCGSLFDCFRKELQTDRYKTSLWKLIEYRVEGILKFSSGIDDHKPSWYWKFQYGRSQFFCQLNMNRNGMMTYINFLDPEHYAKLAKQVEKHAAFLYNCGYR